MRPMQSPRGRRLLRRVNQVTLGMDKAPEAGVGVCRCGHPREAHEHYRRGTDCATCPTGACTRFRPHRSGTRWWLLRLARRSRH